MLVASTVKSGNRIRSLLTALTTLAALVSKGAVGVAAAQSAPYPPSPVIAGVTWDYAGLVRLAPGSDLWPVTWAADDHLYTSWGDGGGFGGTNDDGRVSLGVGRIEGPPTGLAGYNVFGGKNGAVPATFDGKAAGMLAVGGLLYMWVTEQNVWIRAKIGRSADGGRTWAFNSTSGWDFDEPDGAFSDATFLNFGKDYAGARDGYVYGYSGDDRARDPYGTTLTNINLYRSPAGQVMNRGAYEFFAGLDGQGNPIWTQDIGLRSPVFHDSNAVGWATRVMYHPTFHRYLLTTWHDEAGGWGIFDAPEPWGPWTTVAYYENWIDSDFKFGFSFNQKWMSADGLTLDMIFSGTGPYDSFNLIRGTLTLRGASDTAAPAPPGSLRPVTLP